jgi:hypothetical protein
VPRICSLRTVTRRTPLVATAIALVALAGASLAVAAVYGPGIPTRAQYVAKAEKTCAKTNKKIAALTKAASKDAKAGDAKGAANKFGQVASTFGKGVGQLKKLPKPTADRGVLTKWLRSMGVDVKLVGAEAKAYRAGDGAALKKAVKAEAKHAPKTNAVVRGFGFRACLVA